MDKKSTVWKVVNWVNEKGIRFESGTTAITVFDERKHIVHWDTPRRSVFCIFLLCHKSGYLPYFLRFNTFWAWRVQPIYRSVIAKRAFLGIVRSTLFDIALRKHFSAKPVWLRLKSVVLSRPWKRGSILFERRYFFEWQWKAVLGGRTVEGKIRNSWKTSEKRRFWWKDESSY